jgi:hypothetical protein
MEKVKVLADNSIGTISICECGVISVNIPGISLRFNDFQFLSLAGIMTQASNKLMDGALKMLSEDKKD